MDYKAIIKTVAPWISAAIGGPLGALASKTIADTFGLPDTAEKTINAAVTTATTEQLLAMKQADQAFALQMQALGFKQVTDVEAIIAGDRDSARKMQTTIRSKIPALLTCFIVGSFVGMLVLMMCVDVPVGNRDVVVYMVGQLSGGFTAALAFWLGTTNQSSVKTDLLAKAQPIVS